jgi:hypothetical protein
MLWFSVCNSDLEFMITNKLQKKSNENNKPTCIEWAFIRPDPDGKDVLVRLSLLNKLSVLYPMQSKG